MTGVNELMNRYNIETAQGMARIIRTHLEQLNADGEQHARKIGKEWDLDETAIRRLDAIRGLTRSEAIQNLENAEIRSLTEEVKNLNVALLHVQNEALEAHKQVQQAQEQVLKAQAAVLQEKDRIIAIQDQKAAAETKAAQHEVRIEAPCNRSWNAKQRNCSRLDKRPHRCRKKPKPSRSVLLMPHFGSVSLEIGKKPSLSFN